MNKPGRTYHPTTSKLGRRIMAAASKLYTSFRQPPDEIAEWNKAVDAKKKLKLANKGRTK